MTYMVPGTSNVKAINGVAQNISLAMSSNREKPGRNNGRALTNEMASFEISRRLLRFCPEMLARDAARWASAQHARLSAPRGVG